MTFNRARPDAESPVLILGSEECDHVQAVAAAVTERGCEPVIFNTANFPRNAVISYDPMGDIRLQLGGRRYAMSRFRSVYWRSYHGVDPVRVGQEDVDQLSLRDARSLLESVMHSDEPVWFNGYRAWAMHKLKPLQLRRVAELGVPVPETLLTNDHAQATAFFSSNGPLIHKPVFGGSETGLVTESLMEQHRLKKVFAASPVTLQRFVKGTNLRTFVIGDTLFSIEIQSDAVDFRADPDHRVAIRETPDRLRDWSRRICRRLHMLWTAIDWRIDEDGQPYFLEANPSPMFVGVSGKIGLDVASILAAKLVHTPALSERG